jgi:hypothetical protein
MDHSFIPSQIDAVRCAKCKHPEIAHTDQAICESCNQQKTVELYIDMLFCAECIEKEKLAQIELKNTEEDRIKTFNNTIDYSHEIDNAIQVRTDIFNAATISIVELKKAIDDDPAIDNKPYTLAQELSNRFKHLRSVLFEIDERKLQIANEQRAIQVYLNDLASKLRQEEKDKLKLQDINYQPKTPTLKTPKAPAKKKFDKVELRKFAAEIGVSEFTLQMIVVQKNVSVEEAAKQIKASLDAAKAKS